MSQETLSSIIQKFKEGKAIEKATSERQAATEEISRKEREFFELQGFLGPIFETISRRLSFLEDVGITGLINEVAEIYGKEKEWQFVIPEGYRDSPLIDHPGFEYPGKHSAHKRHDPGSSIKTKVLFSKISGSGEPEKLNLTVLEKDMDGKGEDLVVGEIYDFKDRRGLYKKAARKPKQLGLYIEVHKEVLDDREVRGTGFRRDWISTHVVERTMGFMVFEDKPNKIIIDPHGRSGERTFDLRSKTVINDLRNYLGETIATGGDITETPV